MGGILPAVSAGSGLLSAGAQLFGGSQQAGAASAAQQLEQQMYQQMQSNLAPYMKAGGQGLTKLTDLLGLGPGGSNAMQSTLASMPGYNFTLDQGLKSVQNQFTARGLGGSGAAEKGALGYATGLAQSQYGNYANQLQSLAGMGESAATNLGQAGLSAGQYEGNLGLQGANAIAGSSVGAANSIGGIPYNALLWTMMMNQGQQNNNQYSLNQTIGPGTNPYGNNGVN